MITQSLTSLEIFSSLSPGEESRVRRLMKRCTIPENHVLFREGDEGHHMYIVLEGTVAVSVSAGDSDEVEMSRIGPGSFFGEMSIIQGDVRSATCRALSECSLFCLDAADFKTLMQHDPVPAIKIMRRMLNTASERLQRTGSFLSGMVTWGESARIRAVTDDFTGLYNRRFFDEALKSAALNASMGQGDFALVMLDLDRFGTLNAEYGESVGDAVIQAVIPVFRDIFDEQDILARYGGDEFSFILPGRDGPGALSRCRRAGEVIRRLDVLEGHRGSFENVTASIGVAVAPNHGETPGEILDSADKALYGAKKAGRDTAVLFESIDDNGP